MGVTGSQIVESSYHTSTRCAGPGALVQSAARGPGYWEGGRNTVTMRPVNESQKVTEAVRTDPALWGRKNKTLGSPRG